MDPILFTHRSHKVVSPDEQRPPLIGEIHLRRKSSQFGETVAYIDPELTRGGYYKPTLMLCCWRGGEMKESQERLDQVPLSVLPSNEIQTTLPSTTGSLQEGIVFQTEPGHFHVCWREGKPPEDPGSSNSADGCEIHFAPPNETLCFFPT